MSLLLDRSRRPDPHLEWKVRIFSVAAVLGLCGIYFEERWMGLVAILLLASAMALRFGGPGRRHEEDHDPETVEDDEPAGGRGGARHSHRDPSPE